jgi:hypothetical protein
MKRIRCYSVDNFMQYWMKIVQNHWLWIYIDISKLSNEICVYMLHNFAFCELLYYNDLRIVGGGVQTGSTRHRGHLLSYCACPVWLWGRRIIRWNEDRQYSEKTCPSATLSTTNLTWPDPGLNPGRRGEKPPTNRLIYGAVAYYNDRFLSSCLWEVSFLSMFWDFGFKFWPRVWLYWPKCPLFSSVYQGKYQHSTPNEICPLPYTM